MPLIENGNRDRVADALEELCEKLEEQLTSDVPPPVVNVSTPPATSPAPIVNVSAPAPAKPRRMDIRCASKLRRPHRNNHCNPEDIMALTEKYVSSLAGGSGDGNSAGSAYTFGQMVSEVVSLSGAGKRYNIKADGTYVRTSGDNMDVSPASSANPTVLRGYKTTPGDGYLGRSNSNGALITTNMPLITYAVNVGAFCGQWLDSRKSKRRDSGTLGLSMSASAAY